MSVKLSDLFRISGAVPDSPVRVMVNTGMGYKVFDVQLAYIDIQEGQREDGILLDIDIRDYVRSSNS